MTEAMRSALWGGRERDFATLRDLRSGDRNDVVEADRDAAEKFGPAHPETGEDGCEGCGSFAHPSGTCLEREE